MLKHDPAASTTRRAVVLTPDPLLVSELEPLLIAQLPGVPVTHLDRYPAPRDIGTQIGSAPSQLVFLDMSTNPEQSQALLMELTRIGGGTQVLALLNGGDPDAILRCLRAGAADFLIQPFTPEQLEAALSKVARFQPAADAAGGGEQSKIIAVMPAKGACGASTLACNLAFQFKRMGFKRILLADLDPMAGTISFLLKLKSSFSYLDVLQRGSELDPDLWKSTVTTTNGIDVLMAPDMITDAGGQTQDASPILNFARHSYDVVVVDTGSVYGEWNLSQARAANEVLLVTTNELPALQSAQRALSYLETNRIGRWKTRLVVNRYHRDVGLNREVIGTALHTEVFETIPSDYESVQKGLMEGKPVAPGTPFGKGLAQLADRLGGPADKEKKSSPSGGGLTSLLGGLFSKGKK
ncbi:MAG: AAA family ATPase [Acidobacteriota bacterium]